MSLLSDALGRAKQDVINSSNQAGPRLQQGISGAVSARVEQVVNVPRNLEAQVTQVGINGAVGAASDILGGDFSGAGQRILGLPGQTASTASQILGGMGINFGSVLTGPSQGLSVSSVGGAIQPGNALAGALARTDPMMSFLWYCEPPPLLGSGVSSTLPWYFVEEASLPFRTYEVRSVYREGRSRNYPGKYSVDGLSLTFYMDVAGQSLSYLHAWDGLMMKPFPITDTVMLAGGFQMPNMYKKNIPIYIINGNKQQLVRITYTECWPTNLNTLSLQSNASERLTAQITFSVGDVFVDLFQVGSNNTTQQLARNDISDVQTFPINMRI